MVVGRHFVVEDVHRTVICGDNSVEPTIVIQVANRHSPRSPKLAEDGAGLRRNVDKAAPGIAGEQGRFTVMQIGVVQLDRVEIMALCDKEILPSIVIEVEKADSPT